jgi:predicted 3-demethylubiquinone-9 3-methyltransferase (glyoxalase superfamily)
MLSITPFLWFDTQAEEAMQFYASIFPRSQVISVQRNGDQVMSVTWELEGQRFHGPERRAALQVQRGGVVLRLL